MIAELHRRMHDALALHHDLDLLRRQAEQPHCLDQLQTLVHQGGRVNGDLCAHVPVGVLEGIRLGLTAQLLGLHPEEGAAGCREQDLGQAGGTLLILQALEDGRMFTVHRQQLYTMLCHGLCDQMAAGDKTLLVGKGQIMPAFDRAQAGTKACNAHHAVQHHIGAVQCGQLLEPFRPYQQPGRICTTGKLRIQPAGRIRVGHADIARMKLFDLLQDLVYMAVGRKAEHLIALCTDHIQTLGANGTGRTQQSDFFRHHIFLP